MKQKIVIITLIISVFVLGVVFASYKKSKDNAAVSDAQKVQTEASKEETVIPEEGGKKDEIPDGKSQPEEPEPEDDAKNEAAGENDMIEQAEEEAASEPKIPLPKYDELLAVNPYVAGWLKIDDSRIDVPVVYTPGSQNYFLHRDVKGNDTSAGTLFIAIDWEEGYNNTLIYGHNMKDGSGFGSLQKFAKASYGKAHPVIHFDTLFEEKDYELYSVFYSQIQEDELETEEVRAQKDKMIEEAAIAKKEQEEKEKEEEQKSEEGEKSEEGTKPEEGKEPEKPEESEPVEVITEPPKLTLNDIDLHRDFGGEDIYRQEKDEDEGRFRYYYYTDLSDKADFDYFASNAKERSLYDTGVDAQWGDEFITLSTCSYQEKNGRFVVIGVRKKTGTDE